MLEAERKGREYGHSGALDEEALCVSLIDALLLSSLVSASAVVFRVACSSTFALRRVVRVSWIVLFSERCDRSTDGRTLRTAVPLYVQA
jgi:hypothetical protein